MLFNIPTNGAVVDYKQYAAWLIAALITVIGFRYAKEVAALVFEKLYEIFIQHKVFL